MLAYLQRFGRITVRASGVGVRVHLMLAQEINRDYEGLASWRCLDKHGSMFRRPGRIAVATDSSVGEAHHADAPTKQGAGYGFVRAPVFF
jgi:hypothetical protein